MAERPWYSVDYEKTFRGIRWLDTDFEIPSKYTSDESSIRIKIEYAAAEDQQWQLCSRAVRVRQHSPL